jgi:hypothetical protein
VRSPIDCSFDESLGVSGFLEALGCYLIFPKEHEDQAGLLLLQLLLQDERRGLTNYFSSKGSLKLILCSHRLC